MLNSSRDKPERCGYCGDPIPPEAPALLMVPRNKLGEWIHQTCFEYANDAMHQAQAQRLAPFAWETLDFLGHLAREDKGCDMTLADWKRLARQLLDKIPPLKK